MTGHGSPFDSDPGRDAPEPRPPTSPTPEGLGFLRAPVALWVEDYTAIMPRLRTLHELHGDALATWLLLQPAELHALRHGIRAVAANDEAARMVGAASRHELLSAGALALTQETDREMAMHLARVATGAGRHICAMHIGTPRGELDVDSLFAVDGDPPDYSRVVTARVDLTEHERTAADLRHTSAFLGAIVENIPAMVFVKEARELRYVRLNRAGEELIGVPHGALMGKNDFDVLPHDEAEVQTARDRAVLEAGLVVETEAEPIVTATHGTRWVHTRRVPIYDEKSKPAYLLGISHDVTEQRAARQELERREHAGQQLDADASRELAEALETLGTAATLLASEGDHALSPEGWRHLATLVEAARRARVLAGGLVGT